MLIKHFIKINIAVKALLVHISMNMALRYEFHLHFIIKTYFDNRLNYGDILLNTLSHFFASAAFCYAATITRAQ